MASQGNKTIKGDPVKFVKKVNPKPEAHVGQQDATASAQTNVTRRVSVACGPGGGGR